MQVFSEPESGFNNERRSSNVSMGMGDMSQDNTYATIQHPLPANRHRPATPDYTTLPSNLNVRHICTYNKNAIQFKRWNNPNVTSN